VKDLAHLLANPLPTDTAHFDIAHYIKHTPKVEEYDLRQKFEEWRETGVVIFENAVPEGLIDHYLADIEYLCANRAQFGIEVEHQGGRYAMRDLPVHPLEHTGIKLNCMELLSLAARRLSMNALVCDFLGHIFLEPPAMLQSLTFWRGSQQPAHLDYPYVSVQTRIPHLAASWTALEDVHEDSGPLAYYPGSHKPGVIPPYDWGDGSIILTPDSPRHVLEFSAYLAEQVEKLSLRQQVFLPKRGDVLIWHGNLLHEGLPVKDFSRTRRSFVTHFTSRSSYPPAQGDVNVFDRPVMQDSPRLPSWR